jgi:hypothetical protein
MSASRLQAIKSAFIEPRKHRDVAHSQPGLHTILQRFQNCEVEVEVEYRIPQPLPQTFARDLAIREEMYAFCGLTRAEGALLAGSTYRDVQYRRLGRSSWGIIFPSPATSNPGPNSSVCKM